MVSQNRPVGLLLAIRPAWIDQIVAGKKTFEIRRRPPRVTAPLPALLYATAPISSVVAGCTALRTVEGTTASLWARCGESSLVTHDGFYRYLHGAPAPGAIELGYVIEVPPTVLKWRPPQSWMWLREGVPSHEQLLELSKGAPAPIRQRCSVPVDAHC